MPADLQSRLINILLERGLLSESQLQELHQRALKDKKNIEEILLEQKIIPEEDLTQIKSEILGLPYIDLRGKNIASDILNIVSSPVAENYQMIAFERDESALKVALVNPQDFRAQQAANFLAQKNNLKVQNFLCSPASFQAAFKKYKAVSSEIDDSVEVSRSGFIPEPILPSRQKAFQMEKITKSAPVSKIVAVVIRHAVEGRASDIHIEPSQKETRIRYRVDGILHTTLTLPLYLHPAVVSRVKVMANLKLDETRKPQDGRIRLKLEAKEVDIRVSTLPLIDNEKVVMRILDTSLRVLTLKELGFRAKHVQIMEQAIQRTHGMFLVTGPTGAGKTTTLYSLLNLLNKEGTNIVTLEDPIEYYISGVNQSQINPEVGFTFTTGLRSVLRQDPNIIMVGEVRDNETAELAVHAALTGHLVFSSLHTSDAFGAVPRLIDMKVEPFLIASTLNLVTAQRLVRRICLNCRQPIELPEGLKEEVKRELTLIPPKILPLNKRKANTFYKGQGCPQCAYLGYRDRVVIAEVLNITEELQKIITSGCKVEDIKSEFVRQGMINLRQDGLLKALEGITSLEEIMRVTEE